MKRDLAETKDGSHTLYVPALDEHYHSIHGAVQESLHVFLKMGWENQQANLPPNTQLRILETGLGTGLNALLTALRATSDQRETLYYGLEAYPVTLEEARQLNYPGQIENPDASPLFESLHNAPWEEPAPITPHFQLYKHETTFESFQIPDNLGSQTFHLIYFDAFAPEKQPELWTQAIFEKLFRLLEPGGQLVTYSAKGAVRRTMQAAGFNMEKLPGPPGKREMLRATKNH